MVVAAWETYVCESITGQIVRRVTPAAASWSTGLLGKGEGSFTFQVTNDADPDDGVLGAGEAPALFAPNARKIVHRWGDFVFDAKIDAWEYSRDASSVTVEAVEWRNELAWRLTYGVNNYLAGTLAVTNRTHAGAVRAILARFLQQGQPWAPDWAYPWDLPADAAGGFSAVWEYWKKFRISDLIAQIEDEGFEVYLRPYFSGTSVRAQVRVEPRVTIGASTFHLQAEDSPLGDVRYRRDGSRQLTGLQGVGNGSGEAQAVAWAGLPGTPSIPIRDAKEEFPDLEGTRLQATTNARFAAEQNPVGQWSVGDFTITDDYLPEHAAPGRVWNVQSKGDPVLPDGPATLRVISVSGGLGLKLKTEVQNAA